MNIKSDIPQISVLRQQVEQKAGFPLDTHGDFLTLSAKIETCLREHMSESTLRLLDDTARLMELARALETPDKETIGLMMERHPNFIYRKAKLYGIQLMSKPRGRKPKPQESNKQ